MEKLRELLNEFDPYIAKDGEHRDNLWYGVICGESAIFTKEMGIQKIISKEYKFIKFLVENDKIDRERINDRWGDMSIHFTDEELFIMSLSISNTPIKDLISYLK